MSYMYLFIFLFITVYLGLASKENFFKPNLNIMTSVFVALSSLFIYKNLLSEGSLQEVYQKQSLEIFLEGDPERKESQRQNVKDLVEQLVQKKDAEAGELYILARKLKNVNEYSLSEDIYEEIYARFGDDLDGDVIAEYAQVIFISKGRKLDDSIYNLLKEALKKNPNNPSALTLLGLAELENNNSSLTIELWNRAIPLLNSEKEKNDLTALIEAVKKGKNQ